MGQRQTIRGCRMAQNKKILLLIAVLVALGLGYGVWSQKISLQRDGSEHGASEQGASEQGEMAQEGASEEPVVQTPRVTTGVSALDTPNPLGEIRIGSLDAPVVIVEYASLTCPHCGAFHNDTLPELTKNYVETGKAQILFRPFPFDGLATAGAMLVQCVAPQQRYAFLNLLFARQNYWLRSQEPLQDMQALARQAGLSEADVLVCLKDEAVLTGIREMQQAAHKELGVNSTPTFFVNGQRVEGNQPADAFAKVIDSYLPAQKD